MVKPIAVNTFILVQEILKQYKYRYLMEYVSLILFHPDISFL
jgi:hypothetical protein